MYGDRLLSRRRLLLVLWIAVPWIMVVRHGNAAAPDDPPNILLIVSDNQGWKDIGYHGSDIRTPHLDRLAAEGVRLEQYYVYPLCSPTRAALMSGRAPSRFGILGAIGRRSRQALPPDTRTIADVLRAQQYATALVGKWHLGLRPEVGPRQYGFDFSYGFLHGQIDKYTHRYKNGDRTWHRNDQFIDEEGHATDLIADEAVRQIRTARDGPFLLYVAFAAPHTPLQENDRWVKPYHDIIEHPSRRLYAASITHMDAAVGRLVEALEDTGQRHNTLIAFFSDNGAVERLGRSRDYQGRFGPYPVLGDNGSLRGWIGQLYDGSLRTPAFVNWPRWLSPSVVHDVTSVLDWYPTFARLAGAPSSAVSACEGRDIWPLLTGQQRLDPPTLYWKSYNGRRMAVRQGPWKLIVGPEQATQLYRTDHDPGETRNLVDEFSEKVAELRAALKEQAALDP